MKHEPLAEDGHRSDLGSAVELAAAAEDEPTPRAARKALLTLTPHLQTPPTRLVKGLSSQTVAVFPTFTELIDASESEGMNWDDHSSPN